MVEFLNARIGSESEFQIELHPRAYLERPRGYAVVTPIACPAEWQERMQKRSSEIRELQKTFIPKRGSSPATVGTTWFSEQACLGSVSRSSFWTQRNPIIAYWKTSEDPAVVFRVRFLHDGKDFASMALRSTQDLQRVLVAIHSLQRRGDWHRTLDRPEDGRFEAKDLRVRLELTGKGVSVEEMTNGRYRLRAGGHEIVVYPADSTFENQDVIWTTQTGTDEVAVEGICYSGPVRQFDFSKLLDVKLGFGIELRENGADSKTKLPTLLSRPGKVVARWDVAREGRTDNEQMTIAVPNGE